ncbi:MAG: spermidine/putrescine ABC transporter permease PotB [Syntrophobacteraceae bacterium]
MNRDGLFKRVSVNAIALWLVLFVLVPSVLVLASSLLTRGDAQLVRAPLTFENYRRIADPLYLDIFLSSFYLAALSTLICLVVGYPFAYLLARTSPRYRRNLLLMVIIPFWTSSLVRTYAMIIILKTKGLLNSLLLWAGLIHAPLTILYTDAAIFIGLVYSLLPFMVLPIYASVEKLDSRLMEAARDLGASRTATFVRVVIPLTMPGIIAGSMLVFLPALGMFYIPDLLGGAKTLLIGNLIKNQFLSARDWPFGSAASVVLTLVMAVMLLVYYKSVWATRRQEPA